jgi:hypothetical protein
VIIAIAGIEAIAGVDQIFDAIYTAVAGLDHPYPPSSATQSGSRHYSQFST